ncbi:MAG: hypothetical protein ACOYMD_13720 [Paludibacter sp.]
MRTKKKHASRDKKNEKETLRVESETNKLNKVFQLTLGSNK